MSSQMSTDTRAAATGIVQRFFVILVAFYPLVLHLVPQRLDVVQHTFSSRWCEKPEALGRRYILHSKVQSSMRYGVVRAFTF